MTLFGEGKDWIKAPISGTLLLVCFGGLLFAAATGNIERMLLWGILAEVVRLRRDKYLENEHDAE